ncbi:MAG: ribosomal-processing cysteine protease Prp [Acetatifactor sp.]|nr:ribosomal-processing cysteine protease Prp [Acetatifactor sp.]
MTKFVFKKNDGIYNGFYCMGHAGFAKKGKPDILCSAISVLTINTVNYIEEIVKDPIRLESNEETGFIKLDFNGEPKKESLLMLDSLVFGLQNLAAEYGDKYLSVEFEEV